MRATAATARPRWLLAAAACAALAGCVHAGRVLLPAASYSAYVSSGQSSFFEVYPPPGAVSAYFSVSASYGDPDLFVNPMNLGAGIRSNSSSSSASSTGSDYLTFFLNPYYAALYVQVYGYSSSSYTISVSFTMGATPTAVPSQFIPTSTPSAASGTSVTATSILPGGSLALMTVNSPTFFLRYFAMQLPPYGTYNVSATMQRGASVILGGLDGLPVCDTCDFSDTLSSSSVTMTLGRTWVGLVSSASTWQSVYFRLAVYPDPLTNSASFSMQSTGTYRPDAPTSTPAASMAATPSTSVYPTTTYASWLTSILFGSFRDNVYITSSSPANYVCVVPAYSAVQVRVHPYSGGDPDVQATLSTMPSCATCTFSPQYTSAAGSSSDDVINIPSAGYQRTLFVRVYAFSGAPTFKISISSGSTSTPTYSSVPARAVAAAVGITVVALIFSVVIPVLVFTVAVIVVVRFIMMRNRRAQFGGGAGGNVGGTTTVITLPAAQPQLATTNPLQNQSYVQGANAQGATQPTGMMPGYPGAPPPGYSYENQQYAAQPSYPLGYSTSPTYAQPGYPMPQYPAQQYGGQAYSGQAYPGQQAYTQQPQYAPSMPAPPPAGYSYPPMPAPDSAPMYAPTAPAASSQYPPS